MDGYLEDHLLRMAIAGEVNLGDEIVALRVLYLQMAEASAGRWLSEELERESERELHEAVEAYRVAKGVPEGEPFGWVVSPGAARTAYDLAVALDVLVATGVVTAGEAEAFLRARAEAPEQGSPPDRPALDKHLAAVWASLTPRVRSTLLAELDAAGALTSEQMEVYERRLGEPGPDDDWPDERVFQVHPGAVREAFAAPAERVAGVLVVAVELGTESTCLHAHVPPDATAPSLFLRDDLGTTYDGCLPGRLGEDDSPLFACSFMPGVPAAAARLWLESGDGAVRMALR